MRYRAFISYSHADAAWAAWLHRKLEGWRVPRRMRAADPSLPDRLAPIFRDREELASAGELGPQIQGALAESGALIVLCSPASAQSRWVDAEVLAFKRAGGGERIFALIVDGEPGSGDARECFPSALREGGSEPLAADLRPGKDGKELALLKIISGLLGVPLDGLRQREARRRHQRMLAVTAVSLAVMLLTSFLAVQAVIARQAAERRQKQAEALVGFMLGDLNDKLSEVSRLDILEGVHDHAMEYFQSLPDTDLTDEAMAQRALAFTKIGNVRQEQGALAKALAAYEAAEPLAARLARAAPKDGARQLAHAEVLSYIGTTHWWQGEMDQAQAAYERAQAVLLRASALAPQDAEVQYQFGTLDNNFGHILEGRGRIDEAGAHYRHMLASARALVARDPASVRAQNQLGMAHNNLAKLALMQGELAGAVASYRADVAVEAALAASDPRNNAQAETLVRARGALGRTLALAGELDEGANSLQLAVDEARRLHRLEADSAALAENVAIYAAQLARLRRLQGQREAAQALVSESLSTLDALLAKDATNPGWQRDKAEALLESAQLAPSPEAARAALRSALAILAPQLAQQPEDRGALLGTVEAQLRLATLEPAAAAPLRLREALAAGEAQARTARDPRLRAQRAELLLRLGERAPGEALAGELWRGGYRDAAFAALLRQHAVAMP